MVGRFQPFHFGHLYLIKKALEVADKIVIGVGSASIYSEENPLNFEERKKILEAVIKKEKIVGRVLKIVPLEDFFDDKKWLDNVKKKAGEFDLIIGNNDWTNNIMEEAGYKVKRYPYYRRRLYEGWRIRKLVKEGKPWQARVPEYIVSLLNGLVVKNYNVVLGGTFDHFHKGHRALIDKALEVGKKITIGLAREKLYKNKLLSSSIQSYKDREKELKKYLPPGRDIDIVPFSLFTGGADKNRNIDAIVVSRLTYPNALKINELREANKLRPLRIVIVEDILAEDGKLLSSERIRAGEIDRNGKKYEIKGQRELVLPEVMREELRKPLGRVFSQVHKVITFIKLIKPVMVIAVGDIIVDSLLKKGIESEVKIIDFRSRRQPLHRMWADKKGKNFFEFKTAPVVNQPGTINIRTAERLRNLIQNTLYKKEKSWLIIEGEEDLLALPAILFAPLGALVIYGHWQLGVVGVEVTEKTKDRAKSILNRFKI